MLLLIIFTILVILILIQLNRDYNLLTITRKLKTSDGSDINDIVTIFPGKTIFGNTFDFIGKSLEFLFYDLRRKAASTKNGYVLYLIFNTIYNVTTAEVAEHILNDPNLITKGVMYNMLHSFLGTGLLTSTEKKWRNRRKMLTPAFHFNILEEFVDIFKDESEKFIKMVNNKHNGGMLNVSEVIPRFTLNSICETALGVKLDNLHKDGDDYRKNIQEVEELFVKRVSNPLLYNDFMNTFFGNMNKYNHYSRKCHEFSSKIIESKRANFKNKKDEKLNEHEFLGRKQRYAMLDTLLAAESEGLIAHEGICEEVDTFMFEGYDTTSMGLIFSIMNLAIHTEIQEKCFREIMEFGDLEFLKITDWNKMKYLECFIKETLRLYPSVPVIQRLCIKDTTLGNKLILPKGCTINIHIFDINRNPKYYNDPEKFDPERFTKENSINRHPFAYIPFSAGSRNCIGQKFAMLEIKVLLANIIKNFEIHPSDDSKAFRFEAGIILRSKSKVIVKISKR